MEQAGPINFVIWDQVTGNIKRVHANDLKQAEIEECDVPARERMEMTFSRATLLEIEGDERQMGIGLTTYSLQVNTGDRTEMVRITRNSRIQTMTFL